MKERFHGILGTTLNPPLNLYQYLYYTSNHEKSRYKAIITGELIRYVRTNTSKEDYLAMTALLKTRLAAREYPVKLVTKIMNTIQYEARCSILKALKPPPPKFYPPIFKCILPPRYTLLKNIILTNYSCLQNTVPAPRFISTKSNTLGKDQLFDIHVLLANQVVLTHSTAGHLPPLKAQTIRTKKCKHPRCATCTHLNCSKSLKCTRTGVSYTLRHNFIYVITCSKCQKQYNPTTECQNQSVYLMKRQSVYPDISTFQLPFKELRRLEKYWIQTLKTVQPLGLNVSAGSCT